MKIRLDEFVKKREAQEIYWPNRGVIYALAHSNKLGFRDKAYFKVGGLAFIDEEGFAAWQEEAAKRGESPYYFSEQAVQDHEDLLRDARSSASATGELRERLNDHETRIERLERSVEEIEKKNPKIRRPSGE